MGQKQGKEGGGTPRSLAGGPESDSMIFTHDGLTKVTKEDFEMLKVVGKGNFGKVIQVKHKATGNIYAMKILKKEVIVKKDQVEHTLTERQVLQRVDHPFLVRLHYAFQTADSLYLITNFCNGGELFFHLKKERRFAESRARFYAAEIVLAIAHLHEHGVVYRDLKPENVLLDSEGHIILTDFGLAKALHRDGRTHTFCGTPEYLAPEVLLNNGHSKPVDWWSLGTLLYEMLCGLPPFYSENVDEMYQMILYTDLYLPSHVSDSAADLLRRLLEKAPERRLGTAGAAEVKSHPFFRSVNWDDVYNRRITPPFKPSVRSEKDTSNFDHEFTSEAPAESLPSRVLSQTVQQEFVGFTYVNPTAIAKK